MSWPDGLQILFWVAVSLDQVDSGLYSAIGDCDPNGRDGGRANHLVRSAQAAILARPGKISTLDLGAGPGEPPQPPFEFIEEHATGSQPTVSVRDGKGKQWRAKWGNEVKSRNVCRADGGGVPDTSPKRPHFIRRGANRGAGELARARHAASRRTAASAMHGSSFEDHGVREACSTSTAGPGTTTRSSGRASSTVSRSWPCCSRTGITKTAATSPAA